MPMKFSEFKRLLNSDPASQDADYQAARHSDPEFEQAAAASDAFEQQLKRATHLVVDAALTDRLKALAVTAPKTDKNLLYRFRYAIAATVVLAVSGLLFMQYITSRPDPVESYVAEHFNLDGYKLLAMVNEPNNEELSGILATFDLQMDPSVARQVQAVKICLTPQGQGVHFVLNTEQGLVTVIIMPGQKVNQGERFTFDDMAATLVNLPGQNVSLAIIASPELMNTPLGTHLGPSLQNVVFVGTAGA
jgi:hypothetical protein